MDNQPQPTHGQLTADERQTNIDAAISLLKAASDSHDSTRHLSTLLKIYKQRTIAESNPAAPMTPGEIDASVRAYIGELDEAMMSLLFLQIMGLGHAMGIVVSGAEQIDEADILLGFDKVMRVIDVIVSDLHEWHDLYLANRQVAKDEYSIPPAPKLASVQPEVEPEVEAQVDGVVGEGTYADEEPVAEAAEDDAYRQTTDHNGLKEEH